MNRLKVFSLGVIGCVLSFTFVSRTVAQQRGNPEERMQNRIQKLKEKLNLNDEQVTNITAIYKNQRQKMMDLRKSGADKNTMMTQRHEMMHDADVQVTALLTPDQRPKWEVMKAKRKMHNGNGDTKPEE